MGGSGCGVARREEEDEWGIGGEKMVLLLLLLVALLLLLLWDPRKDDRMPRVAPALEEDSG